MPPKQEKFENEGLTVVLKDPSQLHFEIDKGGVISIYKTKSGDSPTYILFRNETLLHEFKQLCAKSEWDKTDKLILDSLNIEESGIKGPEDVVKAIEMPVDNDWRENLNELVRM
jgi:hypothetical protein